MRVIEKSALCKIPRSEIVQYLAQANIAGLAGISSFDRLGYREREALPSGRTLIFLKEYKE